MWRGCLERMGGFSAPHRSRYRHRYDRTRIGALIQLRRDACPRTPRHDARKRSPRTPSIAHKRGPEGSEDSDSPSVARTSVHSTPPPLQQESPTSSQSGRGTREVEQASLGVATIGAVAKPAPPPAPPPRASGRHACHSVSCPEPPLSPPWPGRCGNRCAAARG